MCAPLVGVVARESLRLRPPVIKAREAFDEREAAVRRNVQDAPVDIGVSTDRDAVAGTSGVAVGGNELKAAIVGNGVLCGGGVQQSASLRGCQRVRGRLNQGGLRGHRPRPRALSGRLARR
jgi:hypothetical protein